MDFTFTNEVNIFDLIAFVGFLGWVVGILSGVGWLKRKYANRLESDPMRLFQSHITDLESVVGLMESKDTGYFTQENDGSEDSEAAGRVAQVMADYKIGDMVYRGWLMSCRISSRKNERPYLHIRPLPGLYVVDPR